MAKKVFLQDENKIEILPITRGELVLDSSGKLALHSNEFLATNALPGLMSKEDKSKIDKISISTLEISNLLTTGKKIATISVGSTPYNILAPATYAWNEITNIPNTLDVNISGIANKARVLYSTNEYNLLGSIINVVKKGITFMSTIPHTAEGMFSSDNWANAILTINRRESSLDAAQLGFSSSDKIYYRGINSNGTSTDWKTIAFTDSDITGSSDKVDGFHAMSAGSLLYKYVVTATIPVSSISEDFWYATITFSRTYVPLLTKSLLTADYSNIFGLVYLNTYEYNGAWYAFTTYYNGSNIRGIAFKTLNNPIYYVKLAKPIKYNNIVENGKITVYSPYNCTITVSATAPSNVTFTNITCPGFTNLNANSATKLSTTCNIWGQSFDGTGNVSGTLSGVTNINSAITINSSNNITIGNQDLARLNTKLYVADIRETSNYLINAIFHSPNLLAGGTSIIVFGKSESNKNRAYIGYIHNSDSSDSNAITFGFYGKDKIVNFLANGNVGIDITSPAYKLDINGQAASVGFVKKSSNDTYILLGGGGHKAISDFLLKSETANQELSNNLTTITKTLTVTADWMDTGIKHKDLATGTYIVQVKVDNTTDDILYGYWSGIMSWFSNITTNDTDADEIILHRAGHAYGNTIYLRTKMSTYSEGTHLRLQIAANKTLSTAATYTFKFKRVI